MDNDLPNSEQPHWVIWNGFFGLLDTVTVERVEHQADGRVAWLDEPYEMVGPFDFDELERQGRIRFAECLVMSRQRWQTDQVELRRDGLRQRREAAARLFEQQQKHNQKKQQHRQPIFNRLDERPLRDLLNLPLEGQLESQQIKTAFRRLAQKAHPDAGGSHEQFVEITRARDTLLELCG